MLLIGSSTMSWARTTSISSRLWPPGPATWRRWTRSPAVIALAAPDIARSWRRWALVTSPRRAGHPIRLLGLPLLASGGVAVRVHFGRGAPHRPPGGQPR